MKVAISTLLAAFCLLHTAFCLLPTAICLPPQTPQSTATQSPITPAPLDINRATIEDFAALPGVGPELARRIVSYREKHGPFRRVEDLLVIRGIGRKKWKAIRPYLKMSEEKGKE